MVELLKLLINQQFLDFTELPEDVAFIGARQADVFEFIAKRGDLGSGDRGGAKKGSGQRRRLSISARNAQRADPGYSTADHTARRTYESCARVCR